VTGGIAKSSVFSTQGDVSSFFQGGAVGFSVTSDPHRLDGIRLATKTWRVEPLAIESWSSSFFSDTARFPVGSVELDCALLMRDIEHEWHEESDLYI
jgi:hypothetical protein